MVLYEASNDQMIAYANVGKPECTTAKSFSLCVVDRKESRKSNLKVLIADLYEGQSAVYGCNLTYVVPGGRSKIISWFLQITRISKSKDLMFSLIKFSLQNSAVLLPIICSRLLPMNLE